MTRLRMNAPGVFLGAVALGVFWNWPRDLGVLGSFLKYAGLPWTFAQWSGEKLVWFSWLSLFADVAVVLAVAALCSLSAARYCRRAP